MINEALKHGDLAGVVTNKVSVDEFEPKTGEKEEIAVIGFYVTEQAAGDDLAKFISKSVHEHRDVEVTPNPNSLKFLPGKKVSNSGPYEITSKEDMQNELVRNIQSINGVEGIFLGHDFISVNKKESIKWDEIKHIVISLINDFYADGKEFVIDENAKEEDLDLSEIESKIVKILEEKIRPAVARDGGDIKFKEFKDGIVKVQLQGSCSGCPSSTMTLKQGVQNLLCHYLPEVNVVVAIQ